MRILNSLLSLAALTATAFTSTAGQPEAPMQTPQHFQVTSNRTFAADYLLFLPKDYSEKSERRWPLMLFLHGAGERGTNIWRVAIHGPPKYVKDHPDFPFILVSPQCPEGKTWSKDLLLGLLDQVTRQYRVDTHQVYLTGLSMGGYGTWSLGMAHPEKFAAIVPICGGGETLSVLLTDRQKAEALHTLGVWAFHGAKDPVVPLAESERMVEACKRAGVTDLKFTVYPEAQHDSWTETYNNPDLYKWLLEHRR